MSLKNVSDYSYTEIILASDKCFPLDHLRFTNVIICLGRKSIILPFFSY